MLNRVWFIFFVASAVAILLQLFSGNAEVLSASVDALFASAKLAAEIALGLIGVLSLWMGLMQIGEKAGLVRVISLGLEPLLRRLMPEVPKGHPAYGSITMNLTANFLGLDNAATPLGLKAMHDLQSLNPTKHIATNAQILFLVLNTSSVTLVPVTVFLYRAQQGAVSPADVFIPILLATSASTLVGLSVVAWFQRINLLNAVILGYGALLLSTLGVLLAVLGASSAEFISQFSSVAGSGILIGLIFCFVLVAGIRKVDIYDEFVDGAKAGFNLSISLIPYLLAMLVAIAMLRASGALDYTLSLIAHVIQWLSLDARFVDALPTGLMKPFSGSGARAMMLETMSHYGVDSFAGRLAAVFQGSTETTFYVLAVYFGSVGIRHSRHALTCGLAADAAGLVTAIFVCYWFYG